MIGFPSFYDLERMRRAVEEDNRTQEYLRRIGITPEILPHIAMLHELTASAKNVEAMRRIEEAANFKTLHTAILARQQFERSIPDDFLRIHFRQFDDLYRAFQLLEQIRIHDRHKQVVKILARRGWTGLERHFSERDFDTILKLRKARQPRLIDDYICSKFSKINHQKLNSAVRFLSRISYLKDHRQKIRQALGHHKGGAHAASICILLPLVDGLARQIASKLLGRSKSRMQVKKVAEIHHASEDSIWSECIKQVVCDLMYEDIDFNTSPRRRIVNRHLTLHGQAKHYDTEANSLRVILLLNTFAHIAVINHIP